MVSKVDQIAELASVALSLGMIDDALHAYPLVESRKYEQDFQSRLLGALIDSSRWDDMFALIEALDINKLIEAIASLEQSLNQLGDGLAYEILLACISIAARTRPEWARIVAIYASPK